KYRTTKAREPLRMGEEYDEDRGARADVLIGQCKPIYRDLFLLTFDLQMDDTVAAKFLSRGYCLRKVKDRPAPIDRKEYRALKHQGVAAFNVLFEFMKAA
uniref:hypothetical protein n=1 Tax=uncultured Paraglaciecola sp. TaxID=1765024 RepID=UPI00261C5C3E